MTASARTPVLLEATPVGALSADCVEKLEFPLSITIQKTAGGLDENFPRGSADRPVLPCATLLYALPPGLSAEMTRRPRKRDFRGGPISEFFNTIRPIEALTGAILNGSNTLIVLKNSNFRIDHNSEDRWRPR